MNDKPTDKLSSSDATRGGMRRDNEQTHGEIQWSID